MVDSQAESDPNEGRNDPMVEEHWKLGEDVQDTIRSAGYDAPTVEGIAVDLHDLLQAADRIRDELGPGIVDGDREGLERMLRELEFELGHIKWHCEAGQRHIREALDALSTRRPD